MNFTEEDFNKLIDNDGNMKEFSEEEFSEEDLNNRPVYISTYEMCRKVIDKFIKSKSDTLILFFPPNTVPLDDLDETNELNLQKLYRFSIDFPLVVTQNDSFSVLINDDNKLVPLCLLMLSKKRLSIYTIDEEFNFNNVRFPNRKDEQDELK